MKRRNFLKTIVLSVITIPFWKPTELYVVSYTCKKKHHETGTGNLDYYKEGPDKGYGIPYYVIDSYDSNTLDMTLSNGRKAESWIDNHGILNTSWSHWDEFSFEDYEVDIEVFEKFAAKYFNYNLT